MKIFFQTTLLASALTAGAALQIDTSETEGDADIVRAIEQMSADNQKAIEENQKAITEAAESIVDALAEDCDALGGTDSDALELDDFKNDEKHILRHALWVETSFIPREKCFQRKGNLWWY